MESTATPPAKSRALESDRFPHSALNTSSSTSPIDQPAVPRHIAVIMDGNGRWAQERGLPRIEGHRRGTHAVEAAAKGCRALGVQFLTLYAFSSENWNRPQNEIDTLMQLLERFLKDKHKDLLKEGIRLRAIGQLDDLPSSCRKILDRVMDETRKFDRFQLVLALSYGGRHELVHAARQLAADVRDGKLDVNAIDEKAFASRLYTADIPDPDLLIRTSGEMRLSNFLPWQLSYTELHIIKKYWPDFEKEDLIAAVKDFTMRRRRFGRV